MNTNDPGTGLSGMDPAGAPVGASGPRPTCDQRGGLSPLRDLASPEYTLNVVKLLRKNLGLVAVCLLLGIAGTLGSAAATAEPDAADISGEPDGVGQLAPLVFQGFRSPIPFRGSDGKTHLTYVLTIQNAGPVPVKINRVSVLNARRGKVINSVSGQTLEGRLGLLATPIAPLADATLESSQAAAYWVDVTLSPEAPMPKRLKHRIIATPIGDSFYKGKDTVTAAPLNVSRRRPVRLRSPLSGKGWVDITGCCTGVPNHRHALFSVAGSLYSSQEFAIDFMRFDGRKRLFVGDKSKSSDYIAYGAPVRAVADAKVASASDHLPNQEPLNPDPVTAKDADGNFIMLNLGNGRYANYAHLAPGSVKVKAGDRVRAGQIIGRVGNSGQTGAPHLHFHVMDRPLLARANGLPYEFKSFRVEGTADLESISEALDSGSETDVKPFGVGRHFNQLPLELTVIDFPRR